ncbi:MAG: hypothetical protein SPI25_05220 [Dialister sp.]|nr:hypothetical protein [Dialister sp.]
MARIIAPNKQYTGISASVPFNRGVGETSSAYLIEWFKKHGYTVEDEPVEETEAPEQEQAEDITEMPQEPVKRMRKRAAAKE